MRYTFSQEWTLEARSIAQALQLQHIPLERIACVKSTGTKTRRVIARIHGVGKVMQLGMQQKPFYVIELISERFDRQNRDEQLKTIVHELLHIPHSFGGGFRHHRPHVNRGAVEAAFRELRGAGFT